MNNEIFYPEFKPDGYYASCRFEIFKFIPKDVIKILDVGCGVGNFGTILKSLFNKEVWGIEICEDAAASAAEQLDKVIVGDIENGNVDLPQKYFDCIIFNDVLEHLKYPWIVLRKIQENLNDGGYIIASIPNVRYFYNIYDLLKYKKWIYTDEGILDKTHLRFFTIESIKDMFHDCSCQIITIAGIDEISFPWKFRFLNWIMMKKFEDMKFMRFVCVAQKIR